MGEIPWLFSWDKFSDIELLGERAFTLRLLDLLLISPSRSLCPLSLSSVLCVILISSSSNILPICNPSIIRLLRALEVHLITSHWKGAGPTNQKQLQPGHEPEEFKERVKCKMTRDLGQSLRFMRSCFIFQSENNTEGSKSLLGLIMCYEEVAETNFIFFTVF